MQSLLLNEIFFALQIDRFQFKKNLRNQSSVLLKEIKRKCSNKKVIVIGNGPSLLKTDLRDIQNKRDDYVLIASNGFYLYSKEKDIYANILCVEDSYVAEDMRDEIIAYKSHKIIPFDLINIFEKQKENIAFIDFRRRLSFLRYRGFKFNNNFRKHYYWGSTVTYLSLQIAASLSPKAVYLVGCDLNYKVNSEDKVKKNTYLSNKDDQNHFSPEYFRNKRWHNPHVEMMHIAFNMANDFYRELSIPLFNCSPDSAIKSIPKLSWEKVIN